MTGGGACAILGREGDQGNEPDLGINVEAQSGDRQGYERAQYADTLREPDRHLAEIAQACGFVDQSHFARVFSRSENCSPERSRRLHRS
jgi:AraC-like DNA-binding protein